MAKFKWTKIEKQSQGVIVGDIMEIAGQLVVVTRRKEKNNTLKWTVVDIDNCDTRRAFEFKTPRDVTFTVLY